MYSVFLFIYFNNLQGNRQQSCECMLIILDMLQCTTVPWHQSLFLPTNWLLIYAFVFIYYVQHPTECASCMPRRISGRRPVRAALASTKEPMRPATLILRSTYIIITIDKDIIFWSSACIRFSADAQCYIELRQTHA